MFGGNTGGDDRLQVGTIVFCIVISFVITSAVPFLAPNVEGDADDIENLYNARIQIANFTGASMTNMAPWQLTGIYTPYVVGTATPDNPHLSDSGWLYGDSITTGDYADYIGQTIIKMDPSKKSDTALSQAKSEPITVYDGYKWYYNPDGTLTRAYAMAVGVISGLFNLSAPDIHTYKTMEAPNWDFTGYRYEFAPLTKIANNAQTASDDARLSVVWYSEYANANGVYSEGLSGGLVLMNSKTNAIIANLPVTEIVSNYNIASGYATAYAIDFEGYKLNFNIRFDADVITSGSISLEDAFTRGYWSLAVSSVSASNLLDLQNSTTLATSVGGIIDTYKNIFTFSLPNVPMEWSIVLWVLCILPLDVVMIMFLSRFGIIGVGAGIVGTVLASVLGGA